MPSVSVPGGVQEITKDVAQLIMRWNKEEKENSLPKQNKITWWNHLPEKLD